MSRATGANATLAAAFEETYGTPLAADGDPYIQFPFVSWDLGEEQNLVASDLLGQGREPLAPSPDVINNTGSPVVPVDTRYFGHWLKLNFGPPATAGATHALGSIKFTANPVDTSTITLAGVVWTFVAALTTGNQVLIGANLGLTMTALATALNGSAVSAIAAATYSITGGNTLNISVDAEGTGGNAYTLVAGGTTTGTVSAATCTGGLNSHTFTSGADALPSMCAELTNPEIPNSEMNFGIRGNTLKIAMARSGLLNATLGLIAQGSNDAAESGAGTPSELAFDRFSQFTGGVQRNSADLASVVSADFTFTNDLDTVEVIRTDGRIEDADPGTVGFTGSIVVRYRDNVLRDQAESNEPCEVSFGWSRPSGESLTFTAPAVFLPKAKNPVTGPKGIQATYPYQAAKGGDGYAVQAVLINDVATYA